MLIDFFRKIFNPSHLPAEDIISEPRTVVRVFLNGFAPVLITADDVQLVYNDVAEHPTRDLLVVVKLRGNNVASFRWSQVVGWDRGWV